MLTAKQEKFVRNLIEGMTQREAYKNSYNAENMTDKSIDEEACRLFNDIKVNARYRELQDELAKQSIMTAQERLIYLTELVKDIKGEKVLEVVNGEVKEYTAPASVKNKLSAIDIMNKMQGEYTTNTKVTVSYEDRLKELVGEDEY